MILFFDFETTMKPRHLPWIDGAFPVTLHARYKEDGIVHRTNWILNHNDVPYTNQIDSIRKVFDRATLLVAHNLKFDLHWLRWLGIDFTNKRLFCTMVAEYTLSGQTATGSLSLDAIAEKRGLERKLDKVAEYWDQGCDTYLIPLPTLLEYGDKDVVILEQIFNQQLLEIETKKQKKLVNLRCESLKVTEEIEWNGMKLNIEHTKHYAQTYTETISVLEKDLIAIFRKRLDLPEEIPIKLTSKDHLSAILFGGELKYDTRETYIKIIKGRERQQYEKVLKGGAVLIKERWVEIPIEKECERNCTKTILVNGLGFKPAKGSETKKDGYYSVDKDQLSELKCTNNMQKEVVAAIKEINKLTHMKNTYFDGLLRKESGGYVHPSVNETQTKTGRYSCSSPNLQNQPREGTSPVKECFVSRFEKGD